VLTIVDDEIGLRFSQPAYAVAENAGSALITVIRTGPAARAVTVKYATGDGAATAGADYTQRSGTLTFGVGQVSATFSVPIANDTVHEEPETVTLTLSDPGGGALLGTPATAVLTIVDNDAGGLVQFSAPTYTVSEPTGPGTSTATITVTRIVPAGQAAASAVTVDFAASDGTAAVGSDYTGTAGTLTFGAGELSKTFTIPILHDTIVEGPETVMLALTNPTGGATLGPQATAVLMIRDNDVGGTMEFSAATYTVAETAGRATIAVTRTAGAASAVTVNYASSDGTAVAGTDYGAVAGPLVFAAGQTSATFDVPIVDTALAEGNRTVNLTLAAPGGGGALGSRKTAVLTIVDDEVGLRFSQPAYTVGEGAGSAAITVIRTGPTALAVTVDYATSDGTATAGADYTTRSGTLRFAAGQVSATFSVPIVNDAAHEGAETVTLTLSNPAGGALLGTPASAVLTITD
jgi:hypothetical protein